MSALPKTGALVPGVNQEIYGQDDFDAMAVIMREEAGIVLHPRKAMLVYSRLAPLVRESGSQTFKRFVALIQADPAQRARAVAALTTNHTFFYRESHHFEHLENQVRPHLLRQLQNGDPVRIWSAGCSSGEETWSILMTLLGRERGEGKQIAKSKLLLLASDIAPHALEKAKAATYPEKDFKDVPRDMVQNWTENSGGTVKISEIVRDLVRFRSLNLQGPWPFTHQFDVIFCRNVMIYFETKTKERLVARFADSLKPGAFLYIGHSERVTGPAAQVLEQVGPTIYQKRVG